MDTFRKNGYDILHHVIYGSVYKYTNFSEIFFSNTSNTSELNTSIMANEKCEDKQVNNGSIIANSQKSAIEVKLLTEKVKKPAATVDEVTELLSATSVSPSTGVFRQKSFKTSPLQLKGKVETQEERRKRALEEQKKVNRHFYCQCAI